jgi:hypothetical protein
MTPTLTRIRSPQRPLTVDEKAKLLNLLARVVGVCDGPGIKHGWPYPEVMTDDDQKTRLPMTDEGAEVVGIARRVLSEYGMEPIKLEPLGS